MSLTLGLEFSLKTLLQIHIKIKLTPKRKVKYKINR
jgi:hypothetical protein